MSKQLYDPSPRTGVFIGDLRYGRCNGTALSKHGDFPGQENQPICPLTLALPRDPEVWRKDPSLKEARKAASTHQSIKSEYLSRLSDLKANIHLTIGKHRL